MIYIKNFYTIKRFELINVLRVLYDNSLGQFSPCGNNLSIPVVDCAVSKPICNKTFDNNNFDANFDVARFLAKSESLRFECYTSPYTDQDHKYVVVGNGELKHFVYGQKYQETFFIILFVAKLEHIKEMSQSSFRRSSTEWYYYLQKTT